MITPAVIVIGLATLYLTGAFSRMVLSKDTGIFYQAILKVVHNRLPEGAGRKTALAALREYVYLTAHPIKPVGSHGPVRELIRGQAFCNHMAGIYIRLIEGLDVRGYLVFLRNAKGKSPHSVAYITPGHSRREVAAYLQSQATVVDLAEGVTFVALQGGPAGPRRICRMDFVPDRNLLTWRWYCNPPKIVHANRPISEAPAVKRWFLKRVVGHVPENWLRTYLKLAFWLDPWLSRPERRYYLARIGHLFFRLKEARRRYCSVETRFPLTRWAVYARHYRLRLGDLERCFPERGYAGLTPVRPPWRPRTGENNFDLARRYCGGGHMTKCVAYLRRTYNTKQFPKRSLLIADKNFEVIGRTKWFKRLMVKFYGRVTVAGKVIFDR